MRKFLSLLLIFSTGALADVPVTDQITLTSKGQIIIPASSIDSTTDAGIRMYEHLVLYKPDEMDSDDLPGGETPASIACIYGLTKGVAGCPIHGTTALPTGGWGAIAIISPYPCVNVENDLNVFSKKFGLPACTSDNGCFTEIQLGTVFHENWMDEQAIAVEWAHAMAPQAKIILVSAASNSRQDLLAAEDVASKAVAAAGGGVISNGWGSREYADEQTDDSHFQTPGIVYIASSGDYPTSPRYPSSSPYVISVGGSSIQRDENGNITDETPWDKHSVFYTPIKQGASGGVSLYEPRPTYQDAVLKSVSNTRATPDVSFNADPATGLDAYSSRRGWVIAGGTGAAAPPLAGIINAANLHSTSTTDELSYIYLMAIKRYGIYWHDITSTDHTPVYVGGYDFTTGLGSPRGYAGK